MVVPAIRIGCDRCIQFLLSSIFVHMQEFGFQRVEVALHRSIVIRTAGLAHALSDPEALAEFCEFLRCELAATIAVQDHANFTTTITDRFCQCVDSKLSIDPVAVNTCYNSAVIEIYDRTIVSSLTVAKSQVSEIHTPFAVACVRTEVLLQQVLKEFIRSRTLGITAFALPGDRLQSKLPVHVVMNCVST